MRAKYLLPRFCIHDSIQFDMQHDHVLKTLSCDPFDPQGQGMGVSGALRAKYLLPCC